MRRVVAGRIMTIVCLGVLGSPERSFRARQRAWSCRSYFGRVICSEWREGFLQANTRVTRVAVFVDALQDLFRAFQADLLDGL